MFKSPLSTNAALTRLREGKVLNVFLAGGFASPRLIDFVGRSGVFDVIWFDLEHFDISTRELEVMNMVAKGHQLTTVARLKAADYQAVLRVLETGVDGIMCAMVRDAAEARQIVEWSMFNNPQPQPGEATGNRGWNGGNIDARYANIPPLDYIRNRNRETIVLCQIETPEAVEHANEIALVSGVSGLFFGPGDYSTSIGLPAQITRPEVYLAMERVSVAAQSAGKWWGSVTVGRQMYVKAMSLGGQFLCPGGDVKVLNLGMRGLWDSINAGAGLEAAPEEPVIYS